MAKTDKSKQLAVVPKEHEAMVRYRNTINSAFINLSLVGMRVLFIAISKLGDGARLKEKNPDVEITAKEYVKYTGCDAKNAYTQMKQASDELYNSSIHFRNLEKADLSILGLIDADGKSAVIRSGNYKTRWFVGTGYNKDEGTVSLTFNEKLLPLFFEIKAQFTLYRLADIQGFSSTYPIRMYSMLMQFQDTGFLEISVQELRSRLLPKDDEDEDTEKEKKKDKDKDKEKSKPILTTYADFKRRVINFSVDQINKSPNTKIWVVFDEKKRGRKVEKLVFKFKVKKGYPKQEGLDFNGSGEVIDMPVPSKRRSSSLSVANYVLTDSQRKTFGDWLAGLNAKKNAEIGYQASLFVTTLYSNGLCERGLFADCTQKMVAEKIAELLKSEYFTQAIYDPWLKNFGVKLSRRRRTRKTEEE